MKLDKRKIELAMARKGFTIPELIKESGVTEGTFMRVYYGYGGTRPITVGRIASALDVPVEDIIKGVE